MIVNRQMPDLACKGFTSIYTDVAPVAPSQYEQIAMTVPSVRRSEDYARLGNLTHLREWIGPRVVNSLSADPAKQAREDMHRTATGIGSAPLKRAFNRGLKAR